MKGKGPSSTPPQPIYENPALRQRRKPHILPPLDTRRNSPDFRAEVGSPTPKWRTPSIEEQLILEESPTDGRPIIRLTTCPSEPKTMPPPTVPPTLHIASRYAPLEPIKRKEANDETK